MAFFQHRILFAGLYVFEMFLIFLSSLPEMILISCLPVVYQRLLLIIDLRRCHYAL